MIMIEDVTNLWSEDTDINVAKTWLLGLTEGGTYPIVDRFLKKVDADGIESRGYVFDYCRIEVQLDDCIGPCRYLRLDSPDLEEKARELVEAVNGFADEVNSNPERFFKRIGEGEAAKTDTPVLNCHRFKACGEAREAWLKEHTDGLTFEDWLFAPANADTQLDRT